VKLLHTSSTVENVDVSIAFYRRYGFDYPLRAMVKVGVYEVPCFGGVLRLTKS
jgi:hypothetical protein